MPHYGALDAICPETQFRLSHQSATGQEKLALLQEGEDLSDEDEIGEILRKWNEACAAVAQIASEIGNDRPQPERLDDLISQVHFLEDLREPIVAVLDERHYETVVERIVQAVAKVAAEKGVSWLTQYTGKIQAQWNLFFIVPADVDNKQLRQDVERIESKLSNVISKWQTAKHEMQSSQQYLQEFEENTEGAEDLLRVDDRKVEIQEEIAAATKRSRDARIRIFQVIAPGDQIFDPSKDYEREYESTSAIGASRTREDAIQEPAERTDRTGNAEDIAPTPESKVGQNGTERFSGAADHGNGREEVPDGGANDEKDVISEETSDSSGSGDDPLTPNLVHTGDEPRPLRPFRQGDVPAISEGFEGAIVSRPFDASDSSDATAVATIWHAIHAGRPGVAYHIAKLLTERDDDPGAIPPANLIAAMALAGHVHSAHGEVVSALHALLESIDPDSLLRNDRREQDPINLLLFCATLRPALFAPYTGAAVMLRRISMPDVLTPVYQLAKDVADHADRLQGVRLDADLIRTTLRGGWQDEFMTFASRVADWRNRADSQRIIFVRANRVWRDLFNETGCLAELTTLISKDDAAGTTRIEEIRRRIVDQRAFNDLVRLTDRKHRKGNPIQGRALKQLWDHVQPAIDLSSEWLRLMDAKPGSEVFITRRIEALRADILPRSREAIEAVERAETTMTSAASTATLKHARITIDALLQVFDDNTDRADTFNERPNVIRSRDLLYVTGLDIDIEYFPAARHDSADMLVFLLDRSSHAETLSGAFCARLARGDLIGAGLACEGMDAEGNPEADRCRTSLDRELERERGDLKRRHADEESRLEHAFCRGQVDIDERERLAARLTSLRKLILHDSSDERTRSLVPGVAGARSKLSDIRRAIETAAAARINEAKKRLDRASSDKPEPNERSIIEQVIESGDILAANELMSRMEKGESVILSAVAADPFREFISVVGEIDRTLGGSGDSRGQFVRRVAGREHVAGVSFESLSKEEAEYSANLLEAWYTLARKQHIERQALQDLLQQLGFKVRKLTLPGRGRTFADLETEIIEDRALCPSRQFGSEAKGHYRVLLNWSRPTMDSIASSLGVKGEHLPWCCTSAAWGTTGRICVG